jgi:hypothetical protein
MLAGMISLPELPSPPLLAASPPLPAASMLTRERALSECLPPQGKYSIQHHLAAIFSIFIFKNENKYGTLFRMQKMKIRLFRRRHKKKIVGVRSNTKTYHALQRNNTENFDTNIPSKGFVRPQSQFPHLCVCERFIYSHDRSAYSSAGKYVDQYWEYKNHSQTHKSRKGVCKWDFRCSALCSV